MDIQTGTIEKVIDGYPTMVDNQGYAVATGVFLIIVFCILLACLAKWILSNITGSIKKLEASVNALCSETDAMKDILNELNTQTKVALNIILKNRLNGNDKDSKA
jgi:hypothetical protein